MSVEFKMTADGSGQIVAHHPDCPGIENHVAAGHTVASVKSYHYNRPMPSHIKRCSCLDTIMQYEGPVDPPTGGPLLPVVLTSQEE